MPDAPTAHPAPTRARVILLITGGLSLLCIIALLISITISGQRTDQVNRAEDEARLNRIAALRLTQAMLDMETGQRGYLLSNSDEFLQPFEAGREMSAEMMERLELLNRNDPALRSDLTTIRTQLTELEDSWSRSIDLQRAGNVREARSLEVARHNKQLMDQAREKLDDLLRTVDARIDAAAAEEMTAVLRFLTLVALLGVFALTATGVSLWTLNRERHAWLIANSEIDAARAAAQASDESKTRFLAMASHDMRQPLHALSLYLSALRRRVDQPEAKRILDSMDRATQSMVSMFSQLLDLARIQSGVLNVEIEDVDLSAMLTRVAAEFGADKATAAPTELTACTDVQQLSSIIRNFAANAIKHGGGKARLEARLRGEDVLICVVDNGPGIPPDKISAIFEEFTQLEGASKNEGLGIGLSIVKRIADRLGHPIVVENNPGGGALFGVIAKRGANKTAHRHERVLPGALKGAQVVMIDDDPVALGAAAQIVRDAGAIVHTGESPEELDALLAQGIKPIVLVMDLRLQGSLRGVDVANAARAKLERTPAVIVVTGDTEPGTLELLQRSGYAWLIKPVEPDDFVAAVDYAALRALHGGQSFLTTALP